MVLDMAADGGSTVKMVVSYGGEITRCPDTGKARYAGGENRVVRVGMSERLRDLRARLAALAGYADVRIRYAVAGGGPGGDNGLDALHDVADEHGLWVLVTRLCCCDGLAARDGRVRAFLFPVDSPSPSPPPPPPRLAPPGGGGIGIGVGMPRPASSPSLLESSSEQGRRRGVGVVPAGGTTTTLTPQLPRSQSAMAFSASWTTLSSDGGGGSAATQADSGFEALEEIAAAQRSGSTTGNYSASSSSSVASSSSASGVAAASTRQEAAESEFDALAAIAAAQRQSSASATEYKAACRVAAQADSRLQALATVAVAGAGAGQQRAVQVFPPPATAVVFLLVPVAPVAVFFHDIPVYRSAF